MGGLSIRQVTLKFGFNARHVRTLVENGILKILPGSTSLRPKIDTDSLNSLVEGEHYLSCLECGAFVAMMSSAHLKKCAKITLEEYAFRHHGAPQFCNLTSRNKVKTGAQKSAQSEKLLARFQTPEGQQTKAQISAASRRLMERPGHKEALVRRLCEGNSSPEARERQADLMAARWESGEMGKAVKNWRDANPGKVEDQLAKARENISQEHRRVHLHNLHATKTSKLHLSFKKIIEESGLEGFETEAVVGPFEVDELHRKSGLAVEVDGCYWHGCSECGFPGVCRTLSNDKSKDGFLRSKGLRVLRIKEHEIHQDPLACVNRIRTALGET